MMRRNPYTGIWMNSSPCPPCAAALAKRGRRRRHRCEGQTVSRFVLVVCDCECCAITTRFDPPVMAL